MYEDSKTRREKVKQMKERETRLGKRVNEKALAELRAIPYQLQYTEKVKEEMGG